MEQQPSRAQSSPPEHDSSGGRRSFEYFHALKTEMLREVGAGEEESKMLWAVSKICSELGNLQTIDATLDERKGKGFVKKVKNAAVDLSRRKDDSFFADVNIFPKKYDKSLIEKYKTSSLKKWKADILSNLREFEKYRPLLGILKDVELHPDIHNLLKKYGKSHILELLEPGVAIDYEELRELSFRLNAAIEFRSRKVTELVAYRYARTFPTDGSIEEFLKNTRRLVDGFQDDKENNEGFRAYKLERGFGQKPGTFDGFPVRLIPFAIEHMSGMIDRVPQSADRTSIKKEALKYYLLFEVIHPFSDGNGRVGRAFFAYLQRRFSDPSVSRTAPVHIPVARLESGTSSRQMVDTGHQEARLGSLSLDMSNLFLKITRDERLMNISIELHEAFNALRAETRTRTVSGEEVLELVSTTIAKFMAFLETPEADAVIEKMLAVIETQAKKDTLKSPDWEMVSKSLEKNITASSWPQF